MIAKALEMLIIQAEQPTKELAELRAQITDSFSKDYVIAASTMERLIKIQYSVRHWTKIKNIVAKYDTDEAKIAGLTEWIADTSEQLLDSCGRSRSTSLIASAEMEADEDELKQVLRLVKQFVRFTR